MGLTEIPERSVGIPRLDIKRKSMIGAAATIICSNPTLNLDGRVVWYRGQMNGYDWVEFIEGSEWFVWDFGALSF